MAAALVHDVPEDTEISLERIRGELSERVAAMVASLTEVKALPWALRKRAGIEKYRAADEETRLVAGMDKLDALPGLARDPQAREDAYWERFNAGRALQAWYYQALADLFDATSFGPDFRGLGAEVFGWVPPDANSCALCLEFALRRRGEAAWKARAEARTLWLTVEDGDRRRWRPRSMRCSRIPTTRQRRKPGRFSALLGSRGPAPASGW